MGTLLSKRGYEHLNDKGGMLAKVAITEKAVGADHPDVAAGLESLALLYRETNREKEAESLEKRAACIRAIPR